MSKKQLVLVLSEPTEGQEEEYDRYYEDVHLEEVLATTGWKLAQRFKLLDELDKNWVEIQQVEDAYIAVVRVERRHVGRHAAPPTLFTCRDQAISRTAGRFCIQHVFKDAVAGFCQLGFICFGKHQLPRS